MAVNQTPTLSQKMVAEIIGTAFLVWVGPGSITTVAFISGGNLPFTYADLGFIALAFAFAILAMIYTIGHISGCHINPAVTLAFAVTKRMSWKDAGSYWVAQLIGAFGEHQHVRFRIEPAEPLEGQPQPGLGIDDVILLRAVGEQVRIAQVGDDVTGRWVLTELDHGITVGPDWSSGRAGRISV